MLSALVIFLLESSIGLGTLVSYSSDLFYAYTFPCLFVLVGNVTNVDSVADILVCKVSYLQMKYLGIH